MNLPCTECPVLAVCIIKLKQWIKPPDFTYFADVVNCDKANEYVDSLRFLHSRRRNIEINKARKLFRIQTLPRKYVSPFYAAIEVKKDDLRKTDYFTHRSDCSLYKMKLSKRKKNDTV